MNICIKCDSLALACQTCVCEIENCHCPLPSPSLLPTAAAIKAHRTGKLFGHYVSLVEKRREWRNEAKWSEVTQCEVSVTHCKIN